MLERREAQSRRNLSKKRRQRLHHGFHSGGHRDGDKEEPKENHHILDEKITNKTKQNEHEQEQEQEH